MRRGLKCQKTVAQRKEHLVCVCGRNAQHTYLILTEVPQETYFCIPPLTLKYFNMLTGPSAEFFLHSSYCPACNLFPDYTFLAVHSSDDDIYAACWGLHKLLPK